MIETLSGELYSEPFCTEYILPYKGKRYSAEEIHNDNGTVIFILEAK